ncbi:hypothetical protein P3T22_006238 [Paraburkholderia sp. GAS348]
MLPIRPTGDCLAISSGKRLPSRKIQCTHARGSRTHRGCQEIHANVGKNAKFVLFLRFLKPLTGRCRSLHTRGPPNAWSTLTDNNKKWDRAKVVVAGAVATAGQRQNYKREMRCPASRIGCYARTKRYVCISNMPRAWAGRGVEPQLCSVSKVAQSVVRTKHARWAERALRCQRASLLQSVALAYNVFERVPLDNLTIPLSALRHSGKSGESMQRMSNSRHWVSGPLVDLHIGPYNGPLVVVTFAMC